MSIHDNENVELEREKNLSFVAVVGCNTQNRGKKNHNIGYISATANDLLKYTLSEKRERDGIIDLIY